MPSTEWQFDAIEAWAAERGHEVTVRFQDTDTSGYRRVARPSFDALLAVVRSGEVDGTVIWKLDRLSRQGQWGPDVMRFMDAKGDTALLCVHEEIDASTAAGEAMLGMRLSFAKGESEAISLRWKAQKRRQADAGIPITGGVRWFGWADYPRAEGESWHPRELDPVEASAIRDAAAHLLSGGSLRSVLLAWHTAGMLTAAGKPWTARSLNRILTSTRLTGTRTHHGEVVGPGTWPPILDEVTGERLRRLLASRKRTQGRPSTTLLGGLLHCGKCKAKMVAGETTSSGARRYSCPCPPRGCHGISIVQTPADLEVEARLLARLRTLKVSRRDTVDTEVRRVESELATLDAQLAEAATDYYGDRKISRGQFDAVSDLLGRRADKLRSELGRLERRRVSRDAASILATWDDRTTPDRRTVIEMYVDSIKILPATKGRVFDPARVKIRWAPS